ncbi:MAG: hypothetical protein RRA94_13945 [Bacteroidota bacterium]|nr:hypothetical protein [Bacteroidota bacterium]
MGTQQLLLIVLGVIIVGIAVVVGINIFGTNAEQANKDAITQDCLRIAAAAQGYYRKPTMLGGGNNAFDGITIEDCGMSDDGTGNGVNVNGTYVIDATSTGDNFAVTGTSATDAAKTVTVSVNMAAPTDDLRVQVAYAGW